MLGSEVRAVFTISDHRDMKYTMKNNMKYSMENLATNMVGRISIMRLGS